jgi:quinol monooxygenase YgiN
MYGTVARMRIKPGTEERLIELSRTSEASIPGLIASQVYRMDADPLECYLAVTFVSKEAYVANANSPEQHERYLQYRELLAAEPEWHDGTIVYSTSM